MCYRVQPYYVKQNINYRRLLFVVFCDVLLLLQYCLIFRWQGFPVLYPVFVHKAHQQPHSRHTTLLSARARQRKNNTAKSLYCTLQQAMIEINGTHKAQSSTLPHRRILQHSSITPSCLAHTVGHINTLLSSLNSSGRILCIRRMASSWTPWLPSGGLLTGTVLVFLIPPPLLWLLPLLGIWRRAPFARAAGEGVLDLAIRWFWRGRGAVGSGKSRGTTGPKDLVAAPGRRCGGCTGVVDLVPIGMEILERARASFVPALLAQELQQETRQGQETAASRN